MDEIERFLHTDDVIVLHGARQVGKTSILMYLQESACRPGSADLLPEYGGQPPGGRAGSRGRGFLRYLQEEGADLIAATSGPKFFVLMNEVSTRQSLLFPEADRRPSSLSQAIVSGFSSFEMKSKFHNSLVGRTVAFEIYPLAFQELLTFHGVPFVPIPTFTEKKRAELQALFVEYALYGGYPKIVLTPEADMKERYLQQIIDTYVRKDIRDLAEIRDVTKFNRLLEALASQSGNLLNIAELSNTCALARPSVERYLFLLEQTYIIRLVRPSAATCAPKSPRCPRSTCATPG